MVLDPSDQFIRKIQIWVDNPADQMLVGLRFLGENDRVLLKCGTISSDDETSSRTFVLLNGERLVGLRSQTRDNNPLQHFDI